MESNHLLSLSPFLPPPFLHNTHTHTHKEVDNREEILISAHLLVLSPSLYLHKVNNKRYMFDEWVETEVHVEEEVEGKRRTKDK